MTDAEPTPLTEQQELTLVADAFLYEGIVQDEGSVCPVVEGVTRKAMLADELVAFLDECGIDAIGSDPTVPVVWDELGLGEDTDVARRAFIWYHRLTNELDALSADQRPASVVDSVIQQVGPVALEDLEEPSVAELEEIEATGIAS